MALEARRATRLRARAGVSRRPPPDAPAEQQPVGAGGGPLDVNS
jgi:hypothetical protein